jgi:hypothetical protein
MRAAPTLADYRARLWIFQLVKLFSNCDRRE